MFLMYNRLIILKKEGIKMDNYPYIQDVPEPIVSDTSTSITGPPLKPKWYFNTWFIVLLSFLWFFHGIPLLLAIILAFLKNREEKKLYKHAEQLYLDNSKYNQLLTPEMYDVLRLQELIKDLACEEAALKDDIKQYEQTRNDLNSKNNHLDEQIQTKQETLGFLYDLESLDEKIKDFENQIKVKQESLGLLDNLENLDAKSKELTAEIKEKRKELIVLDNEILVQEFGLYEPQFDFASALDYKEELAKIRTIQKDLIKNKKAVDGSTDWSVNGSKAKGKKMVTDTQKLLLRAFNNECDDLVAKIKYTNFDASLDKIYRSAETISKLGTVMNISVNQEYLDSKVKELRLAFEYRQKQQEEKEALKAAREEQREQAKVQKEIEAQRKRIEKEQAHYETAYQKLMTQLSNNGTDEALLKKKTELENHLTDIDRALADIDYRQANMRAGYVYIISNIGAFGENVYKIGMTRRLDPQERVDELGDASVPFRFDVHAMIFSDDAPALEAALHRAFEDRKLNMVNTRREFFNVTLDEIKEVVKANFDKTVEFIDVPDAEQYRVSQKMKNEKLHN